MVHGDLSEFNILVTNNDEPEPYIIDVSQSRLYNNKTFTSTPVRIRIDKAISVLERDVKIVVRHFEQRYRLFMNLEDIFEKFYKDLPDFAKRYTLIDQESSTVRKRLPREFFIDANEVNSVTTLHRRSKERRIHKKIQDSMQYY